MDITFDPTKDQANKSKHGISLAMAKDLNWDEMVSWLDGRFEYNELRVAGIAPLGDTLYYVAFVTRNYVPHVISLRKAVKKEVQRYVESYS